jgi:Uncharacterized protein conserved in bacteria (DUF2066)
MALRLMTACALLLLGAVAMRAGPAPAEEADEAYSATVKVDATADSAAAARETARIDGQRRALAAVIERLSGASEPAKPPKLDDKAITDMVASFEVANERMSAVRYVADYTFHFRPSKVRRLVRVVETPPAENGSKSPPEKSPGDKRTSAARAPLKALASQPSRAAIGQSSFCRSIETGRISSCGTTLMHGGWPGRSGRPGRGPAAWCYR